MLARLARLVEISLPCKRFETFLNDRCKGKDVGKLRFVVE